MNKYLTTGFMSKENWEISQLTAKQVRTKGKGKKAKRNNFRKIIDKVVSSRYDLRKDQYQPDISTRLTSFKYNKIYNKSLGRLLRETVNLYHTFPSFSEASNTSSISYIS